MKQKKVIAIVGTGFVFDIYMRTYNRQRSFHIRGIFDTDSERLATVSAYYKLDVYDSFKHMLSDVNVDMIVNLTSIEAHYDVNFAALSAGKNVYSEKPLTKRDEQADKLFTIAREKGVRLFCAPSNLYSDTVISMITKIREGAIGKPLLIYGELDDNPIHLMNFEGVRSPSGAPWPLISEIYEGCTLEHAGYHISWLCAAFGPVEHVTASSDLLIETKRSRYLREMERPTSLWQS